MSNNKFNDGTFTLNVAFENDLNSYLKGIDFDEVKGYIENEFFKTVSLILERATYGQHNLKINLSPYKKGITDILITKNNTDAFGSHLWTNGHMEFSIDHIYSPGLMLHELGHYLYGLGDEYRGCRPEGEPASIMQYSFGNNVRYRKKGQDKEYKVLGGFDDFWEDYSSDPKKTELLLKPTKELTIVTNFCHNKAKDLLHNDTGSEHDKTYGGKSCWEVMIVNQVNKINGENAYTLIDPFDENGELKTKEQMEAELV